ncbi:MAG: hypothetical protein FJW40_09095 [Acidobacteria bacterium]|nr:hypothetical protein [Acidobacteriota bacterium]
MFQWTKRQFVRLAGLAIAGRIAPRLLPGAPVDAGRKVIIVTFGGGVRYSETFSPEGLRNIPALASLRPKGFFYSNCANAGVLSHFNSSASILTGNWQRVDDFGFERPAGATIFEQFRKQRRLPSTQAWAICTNKSFSLMNHGAARDLGEPYGANLVLPKQLLIEAVDEVVKQRAAPGGVADRDAVLRQLEGVLNEGYEGIGWTIFKGSRDLDNTVRATLTRSLVEYINGPELPSSGDELTFFVTREVMREFGPRLLFVNFWDMDVAHWGSYSLYLQAVARTDRLVGMLWEEIETNPRYKGRTTLLVLPELGRDGDVNTANGFLNHRSGDASCRNMWLLALGAGVARGESDQPVRHIDVASTAAGILGFHNPEAAGKPLSRILL